MKSAPSINRALAQHIFAVLRTLRVHEIIICGGARNSPLLKVLRCEERFQWTSFFEERSAAFYALGRSRVSRRPVAVITTSGTAVAELLPAAIEAFYSGVPLIFVTADRPQQYRGTGASQTIIQPGLFGPYVEKTVDVEGEALIEPFEWSYRSPIHLNVCFDEPLIDAKTNHHLNGSLGVEGEPPLISPSTSKVNLLNEIESKSAKSWNMNRFADELDGVVGFKSPSTSEVISLKKFEPTVISTSIHASCESSDHDSHDRSTSSHLDRLSSFLRNQNPLIVVGPLEDGEQFLVKNFLEQVSYPFYCEIASGLKSELAFSPFALPCGERHWNTKEFLSEIDSVLRVGGVPTLRFWRDLETQWKELPVFHLTSLPFPGLTRGDLAPLSILKNFSTHCIYSEPPFWRFRFMSVQEQVQKLLTEFPNSEPAWVHKISQATRSASFVYLGNSLPIREWDLFSAPPKAPQRIGFNRGANGIDGQISTFLGQIETGKDGWGIFGDLTTMYDMTSPWVLRESPSEVRIVIINNQGGKIFRRMFRDPMFENAHEMEFQHWAQLWKLPYKKISSLADFDDLPLHVVLEVQPNAEETEQFWNSYEQIRP